MYKDLEKRRKTARQRYALNPEVRRKQAAYERKRRHTDESYRKSENLRRTKLRKARPDKKREVANRQTAAIKLEVLTQYGKKRKLQCCWRGCTVVDIDMLTLDHINNDGAKHRRELGNKNVYRWVRRNGFPEGFQTLCGSHQLKKLINFIKTKK